MQRRRVWGLLAAYVVLALLLAYAVPPWIPAGPVIEIDAGTEAWQRSAAMGATATADQLTWMATDDGPSFASRIVNVADGADSIRLRACSGEASSEPGVAALMLASENSGSLDFNRAYRLYPFENLAPGECEDAVFSRWEGDGRAVLQIQFLVPRGVRPMGEVQLQSQHENRYWRLIRWVMLPIGLVLVAWQFSAYARMGPRIIALGGLLVVAGILFGVCVSVPLKADIYALMTGGRSMPTAADPGALLNTAFPIGGFSIFTQLHAVFFASACFALTLVERRAWTDLVILALVTETLQLFVPGRGPGLSDSLVDLWGVLLGLASVFLVLRSQRVRLLLEHQGIDKNISRF